MRTLRFISCLAIAMAIVPIHQPVRAGNTWADYIAKAAPYGHKLFSVGQTLWEKREIFYVLGFGFLGYKVINQDNKLAVLSQKVGHLLTKVATLEVEAEANNLAKIRFDEELRKAKSTISDLTKVQKRSHKALRVTRKQVATNRQICLNNSQSVTDLAQQVSIKAAAIKTNTNNIDEIKNKQEKDAGVINQLEKDNALHKQTIASIFHSLPSKNKPIKEITEEQTALYNLKCEVLAKVNNEAKDNAKKIKISSHPNGPSNGIGAALG